MHPFIKIILAETEAERDLARAALFKSNTQAPTDHEASVAFLKDCTTLEGAPLTVDDTGAVVSLQ